ncbi:MAG: ECF transporter S component [Treponema sp.]|nr:ECF transporter S component [Treponema sp.]
MTDSRIKKMATSGVLAAVSIVLGLTGLGFVTWIPGASLTIMHVPVIIGAILEGPLAGAAIGFLFGVFSLIQASIIAVQPADVAFVNPLISVLPRLLIGPAAWFVYALLGGGLFRPASGGELAPAGGPRETVAIAAGALAGSIVNTVLVLSALAVFRVIPWQLIAVVASFNGPVEAALAAVLTLAVVLAWKRVPRRGGKAKLSG